MIALKKINPFDFLDYLFQNFKYIYVEKNDGNFVKLGSKDSLNFIHNNLVYHGCVDNLLISNIKL